MIKKLFQRFTQRATPTRCPAEGMSIRSIPSHVLSVVDKLSDAGHEAYLVGGCVRDLLTGMTPKDFDVATSATPEQVRRLFRNSRLIGRRFVLVHVFFGPETVEVATFRGNPDGNTPHRKMSKTGQILQDNAYGTIEEDALRRDFTINALFYDPRSHEIIDFTNGLADIKKKLVRLIGEPETRYREDPMRMLRALRFAAKLNFKIEKDTDAPMRNMAPLLLSVPSARLFEETMKLFLHGYAVPVMDFLRSYKFDEILFKLSGKYRDPDWALIYAGLSATDARYRKHKKCSTTFLISLLLFATYRERLKELQQGKRPGYLMKEEAMNDTLKAASQTLCIPKRVSMIVRGIWHLQYTLVSAKPHQVNRIVTHPQFRPALDLLCLRAELNEPELLTWAQWWQTHYGHVESRHE